jgi:hypothetical protein
MYSIKKPTSYAPPSQRKVDPLTPDNFPSLSPFVKKTDSAMNFLEKIRESERVRKETEALFEVKGLSKQKMEAEGWAVLSLRKEDIVASASRVSEMAAGSETP